jgi:hypothetical protein
MKCSPICVMLRGRQKRAQAMHTDVLDTRLLGIVRHPHANARDQVDEEA